MSISEPEVSRLRGLIFESLARPELFDRLVQELDELSQDDRIGSAEALSNDFSDASETGQRAAASHGNVHETGLELNLRGEIVDGTLSAFQLLSVTPGQMFREKLGQNAANSLDQLLNGETEQTMFTMFGNRQARPMLMIARRMQSRVFVKAIHLRWNTAIAPTLRTFFALTETEIDLAEHIFEGNVPKEIARKRGRSTETVRTQVRSILRKTDTHGVSDLIHLIYGLLSTAQDDANARDIPLEGRYDLKLPSGRIVDLELTGPVEGEPLLFIHGCLGGRRLNDIVLQSLSHRRIIAPGRPGHGSSTGLKDVTLSPKQVAADLLAVLDHLGIRKTEVLSYDLGAPFALWLAAMTPTRVKSLTCLAPVPPLTKRADLKSLPKTQRVFPTLASSSPTAAHYLAQLGGQLIVRRGPDGFGDIVFAGSPSDQRRLEENKLAKELFWQGHAWHVEQGPVGFLGDAQLCSSDWDEGLRPCDTKVRFLIGTEDQNVPRRALAQLAQKVGADCLDLQGLGHAALHDGVEDWLPFIGT